MEKADKKIYPILKKIASEMGADGTGFKVERPKDTVNGDLASNIALVLAKKLDKNPLAIAEEIAESFSENRDFSKVVAAKPGFVNFYFSKEYLQNQVQNIIAEGPGYGSLNIGRGASASVEFVSANPTGPLHIGNARGGPLGDTIANVLEKAGYKVVREYLHNDVGGQVERLGEAIFYELNPEAKSPTYEVQYQGEYIKELAKAVEEELQDKFEDLSDEKFMEEAGNVAVGLMLEEIISDCRLMGISFDKVTKESELRRKVPAVLSKIKNSLKEYEGAVWFAPNDEFLKDRETVVKKSNGQFTYFASDIAYHDEKMSQNNLVVDILGSNHSGHVPRILAAIKALGHSPQNFRCVLYQYVRLKRNEEVVKMSKRAGNFVTAREVLDEVGKDAFRFFLLTPRTQTHMDFDLDLAKKRSSENPVFYVQYAYTRIASIFAKASISSSQFSKAQLDLLQTPEEMALIRKLIVFPSLVEEVARNLEVNAFINYSLELATLLHKFYESQQVISKNKKLTQARLALLKATQITLKNTLDLLGVSALEKM